MEWVAAEREVGIGGSLPQTLKRCHIPCAASLACFFQEKTKGEEREESKDRYKCG